MKTVEEIRAALDDVGLDSCDWSIEDLTDTWVKLVPRDWIPITYKMLAQIEQALGTDRINIHRVDATPGHRISSVTYEPGEPGHIYLEVFDK